jgi:hypothetical protein
MEVTMVTNTPDGIWPVPSYHHFPINRPIGNSRNPISLRLLAGTLCKLVGRSVRINRLEIRFYFSSGKFSSEHNARTPG